MSFAWRCSAVLALCGLMLGCNAKSYPKTIKVSGTVTLASKPVEGATVTFIPKDSKVQPATGRTDAQGKYTLTSFRADDGAQPGDYQVTVTKYFQEAGQSPYDKPAEEPAEAAPAAQSLQDQYAAYEKAYKDAPKGPGKAAKTPKSGNDLPARYSNIATSGFAFTISDEFNTFDLELVK